MKRRPLRARGIVRATVLVGIMAVVALTFGSSATYSGTNTRLEVSVVATNRGPVPACSDDGSDCTDANIVSHFIYVENANRLTNRITGTTRATLPNTFVVSSVDATIFIDGVGTLALTALPPPNAFVQGWSGRWPSTVSCPPGGPPCTVVGSPAVVPGENAAVLYASWVHLESEPNGRHVFEYTVRGTLNGAPVDLTASSPSISLTD